MIEINAFQKRCETLLNRELEENGLKLFDREVVFSRDETFIEVKVADFKIWIYDDGWIYKGEILTPVLKNMTLIQKQS